jgi:hypothetical protein
MPKKFDIPVETAKVADAPDAVTEVPAVEVVEDNKEALRAACKAGKFDLDVFEDKYGEEV